MEMEETDESRPRRKATWVTASLFFVVVLYPLSFGPAFAMVFYCANAPATWIFRAAYMPLIAFSLATGTGGYLEKYGEWWLLVTGVES